MIAAETSKKVSCPELSGTLFDENGNAKSVRDTSIPDMSERQFSPLESINCPQSMVEFRTRVRCPKPNCVRTPDTIPELTEKSPILPPSEGTKQVYRELSVIKPSPAVGAVLDELPGRYTPYRSTLWSNIRHHSLGGRTESERFMDRRSWGDFENRAIRRMQGAPVSEDDASTFAPSKRKIYPARVSKEDVRRRALKEAVCFCGCGRKLNAKRRKAKWATDACRMRVKRKG